MEHRDPAAPYLCLLLMFFLTACAASSTPITPNAPTPLSAPATSSLPPSPVPAPASTAAESLAPSPSAPAPSTAPPSAAAPSATATAALTVQSNPLDVTLQIDAARAVSQVISLAGGTVSTTARDGTRFTLTVPDHALLRDTMITLIPAALDKRPPEGSWSAAVQMSPEDLVLMQPVTLTLDIPNAVPTGSLLGMSYHGAGAGFHLYPLLSNGATLSLPLMHFSGYGVGQALAALVQGHVPATSEDRAEQELATLINESAGKAPALDDAAKARAVAIFHQWFQELQSEKSSARGDAAATLRALASSRAWSGLLTLMLGAGGGGQNADDQNQSAEGDIDLTIFDLTTLYTLCQRGAGFSAMLGMIDDWQALARTISPDRANELGRLLDLVEKCATLKLSFVSEVHGATLHGGAIYAKVNAVVPLTLAPDLNSFKGEGKLVYSGLTIGPNPPGKDCSPWVYKPDGSTFSVPSLFLLAGMESRSVGDISVTIDPGEPHEIAHSVCKGQPVPWNTSAWKVGFAGFHGRAGERVPGGWRIRNFEIQSNEAINETDWPTMNSDAGSYKETDTILITHTPQ